jgi:nucleoside-diphosphate-sugar epimerase
VIFNQVNNNQGDVYNLVSNSEVEQPRLMSNIVLITGSAGYLGSVLTRRLLEAGYRVRALDLYRHPHPTLAGIGSMGGWEAVRGDCRDASVMRKALEGVAAVIPLAAVVGAPACDARPLDASSINYGAISLLLSLRSKEQLILYLNTNSAYGTNDGICTEDTPSKPLSHYARTKCDAESAILDAENSVVFRLATVFGPSPRMRLDLLVNDFVYRAVSDRCLTLFEPNFRRNYIHIQDVASLFTWAMASRWALGRRDVPMEDRLFNAGLPQCLTKRQLCELIKVDLPHFQWHEATIGTDPDKRDYNVSSERLFKAGFYVQTSLREGILELIRLYKTFPSGAFSNA